MKHLWAMLNCKPKEWRRIAKALHVMDYLIKNGAPRVIADLKDDLYKIRQYENFSFREANGVEQGVELRDKVKGLVELVQDPNKLQYEREFAKQTREKFMGIASTGNIASTDNQSYSGNMGSAAPPSGNKYGGFGSEDIARFGYNNAEQFGNTGVYDPYTKTVSTTTKPSESNKKAEESKNNKKYDMDSSDSSDSDADSDDSEYQRKKAKKEKKKAEKKAA